MSTVSDPDAAVSHYSTIILSLIYSLPIVISILGYALFTTPELLHKKWNLGPLGRQSLIGHRGSRLEGVPENTVAAFKDALRVTKFLELDVWLTRDNHVVVHHDDTFKRMTNGEVTHAITDLCYHEFPPIHHGLPSQSSRIKEHHHHECLRFPTLEEVLRTVPKDVHFIIEFKQDSDLLIKLVHELLAKFGRLSSASAATGAGGSELEHNSSISRNSHSKSNSNSFSSNGVTHSSQQQQHAAYPMDFWFSLNEKINKKLYCYDPAIPRITSVIGMLRVLVYYYLGVLPLVHLEEQAFGITLEVISLQKLQREKSLKGAPQWLLRFLAFCLRGKPPAAFIQPALFAHLRARGMPVYFLGVNSERELMIALKAGATGVLSDRVTFVATYMNSHPQLKFKQVD